MGKEVTEYYLSEGQKVLKARNEIVPYELTYLEGELKEKYLDDLQVVQEFASLNRDVIVNELVKGMKWKVLESYTCIHNYVENTGTGSILRKGAISAKVGEKVIIPINMRDGVLSRFTVSSFKSEMKGIYSTCIGKSTLDEAPFAYRAIEDIQSVIKDTVTVDKVIRPIYNFKAGEER